MGVIIVEIRVVEVVIFVDFGNFDFDIKVWMYFFCVNFEILVWLIGLFFFLVFFLYGVFKELNIIWC